MKRAVKFICLMLLFSVEVRVRAKDVFVESQGAFQNLSDKIATKSLSNKTFVTVEPKAVFSIRSEEIHWVSGRGLVKSNGPVSIVSIYGKSSCEQDCVMGLEKETGRLRVHALSGQWRVEAVVAEAVALEAGSSIDLMSVSAQEVSQIEFPYTISLGQLEKWMTSYLKIRSTDEAWTKIQGAWSEQVEKSSALYKDRAQRQIASHEADLARKEKAKSTAQKETARIRAEFRRRQQLD